MSAPGVLLDWDSRFFGKRIARVQGEPQGPDELREAVAWARGQHVDCLYYLAPAHSRLAPVATELGFFMTDVRVTLRCRLSAGSAPLASDVRNAGDSDLPQLCAIAEVSHRITRFHFDPGFDPQRADALYVEWIRGSVAGRLARTVLVKLEQARPVGYVTCDILADGSGSIGLFAIAEEARGKGHGGQLLSAAKDWFSANGVTECSVVTQARALPALAIYQRFGFSVSSSEIWYHAWPQRLGEA